MIFAFPGTRAKYAPDRAVDIEHLALVLAIDPEARRVEGTATIRARVVGERTSEIALDAVELEIRAVRGAAAWRHDGRRLVVTGDFAGTIELAIDYAGAPRRGLYFIAPDDGYPAKPRQVWTQGQDEDARYWFPCFDTPGAKATTEVTVTVPAHLFALSNGALVSDRTEAGRRTLHWRLDVPHSPYLVAAANALAQLVRGRRDREARDVRERLEQLLGDRDFRVQAAAIEALFVVGDPAANAALTKLIDRDLDGRLRRRGREVVRELAAGAPLADEVRRLRDEVGELRGAVGKLRDRVQGLEPPIAPAARTKPKPKKPKKPKRR